MSYFKAKSENNGDEISTCSRPFKLLPRLTMRGALFPHLHTIFVCLRQARANIYLLLSIILKFSYALSYCYTVDNVGWGGEQRNTIPFSISLFNQGHRKAIKFFDFLFKMSLERNSECQARSRNDDTRKFHSGSFLETLDISMQKNCK